MKKLKDIESELKDIAISNGFSGDSVDLLIKLLAYNRYESDTSTRISLLESIPDRAANLNSNIIHAMNEMYSLYRGDNSRVEVKVKVNGNVTLNKFDKVYSDKNNTLFYSHCIDSNGTIIHGEFDFLYGSNYTLVLIKSEVVKSNILSVNSDNEFILESIDSDISETYQLVSNIGSELPIPTTKDFGNHIDKGLDPNSNYYDPVAFDLTIPDYGLRVYAATEDGFSSSHDYTLTYIPFDEDDIEVQHLNKLNIPGFIINLDELLVIDHQPRESINNFLYNLKREAVTQNRTRSNTDIIDAFLSSFSAKVMDVCKKDYLLQEDVLRLNYIPINPSINPSPFELNETELQGFINNTLYYVTKNIEFYPLYDDTDAINIKIELNITISEPIDVTSINEYLREFEYKLNGRINKDEILGKINEFNGVKYCSLNIFNLDSDTPEVPEIEVVTGVDSYFKVTPNLTYSYKI